MLSSSRSPSRDALLVVGMHRSGTSALGGVLTTLGAQAPQSLMPPNENNPKGYWESTALMKAHDRLLASAGSRWNDWSRFDTACVEPPIAEELAELLATLLDDEYGRAPLFVLKDPRISRFLPFWLDVLQKRHINAKVVIPIRHPLEVAASMGARDGFGTNDSLLLWLRHMLDAEAGSRGALRTFVQYDLLLDSWQATADKISRDLAIEWPNWSKSGEAQIAEYLTRDLRHHAADGAVVQGGSGPADWVNRTYQCLLKLTDAACDADTLVQLDEVRREFDRTSSIYAPVLREHEAIHARERDAQAARLADLEQAVADREKRIQESQLEIARQSRDFQTALRRSDDRKRASEQEAARNTALLEFRLACREKQIQTMRERSEVWSQASTQYRQLAEAALSSRRWKLVQKFGRKLPVVEAPSMPVDRLRDDIHLLRGSELFDSEWYLSHCLSGPASKIDPVQHYLVEGAVAGLNPGPAFDTVGYLMRYHDVCVSGINPLVHYIEHGKAEGREIGPCESREDG